VGWKVVAHGVKGWKNYQLETKMVERVRIHGDLTNAKGGPLFAKGNEANKGGRPKGVPNKLTTLLKDAIVKAAEELGEMQPVGRNGHRVWKRGKGGLLGYLTWLGANEPRAFATLLGKVIPLHVIGELNHNHREFRTKDQVLEELQNRGIPVANVFPRQLPPPVIDLKANKGERVKQ
jgi:hypothetical protein